MSSPTSPTSLYQKRPATYIKVIDLAQSYNIDAEKIKIEIEKINNAKCSDDSGSGKISPKTTKEDSHSTLSKVIEDSGCSGDKHQQHRHKGGISKAYPKRFSSMNGGFNLCLLVGKVELVVDKFRVDESRVRLAEVQVGDETGSISLRARDSQIDELEKISNKGGAVILRNSSIELYQGKHLRLAVTKWGKINVHPDSIANTPSPPSTINTAVNLSVLDLNLVPPNAWLHIPATNPPASLQSGDSSSRLQHNLQKQQYPPTHQGNQNQYRKKGRGHQNDRLYQSQNAYRSHDNTPISTRRQDHNYNAMMGMTQNMMNNNANAFSSIYPGTQYYPNYGNMRMQNIPQTQQYDQPKHRAAHQQFILMQQQQYHLQQQMDQMGQLLYNTGQSFDTQSQTSGNYSTNATVITGTNSLENQMPMGQNMHQQSISGSQMSLMQEEISDCINQDSAFDFPVSQQMNPNAMSFAPQQYNMPGAAMNQSQQQYYFENPQSTNYYASSPAYATNSHGQATNQQIEEPNEDE